VVSLSHLALAMLLPV